MTWEKKFRNVFDFTLSASQRERVIDTWEISNEIEMANIESLITPNNQNKFSQMSAARAKKPTYRAFRQPYLGLDMFLLQDIYANTPAGRVVDFVSYLITGGGFKPVLKLRDETQHKSDMKKMQEEVDKFDDENKITSKLIQIDNTIGNPGRNSTTYEHTLFQKFDGMLKTALVFGKAMNVRIKSGNTYDLYAIHPRDMVWNIVDEQWKLQAVMTTLADEPYTMDQLVYAEWNPESPIFNTMYHGFSYMQRMLDSARALRRIKGTDMQLIAKKKWMGTAIIAMTKRDGKSDAKMLVDKLDAGKWYASEETDPEKAYHVHEIPLSKGTEQVVDMATWLTNDIISLGGIPTTLFYDESSANHSVFDIRIRAFQKQIEEEFRSWASAVISKQWYMRNFYDIFGDTEIYEEYEIECEFKPIDFSSLEERTKALDMIHRIFPVTPEFAGEQLKIENFEDKIDTEKMEQQQEMEQQQQQMNLDKQKESQQQPAENKDPKGVGSA